MNDQKTKATMAISNQYIAIRERMKQLETRKYESHSQEEQDEYDKLFQQYICLRESYDFMDVAFEEEGRWGVKNILGELIVPPIYEEIPYVYHFTRKGKKRPYAVKNHGLYGLVAPDGSNRLITNFLYNDIIPCNYTYQFYVKIGDKNGLIDCEGRLLIPPIMDEIYENIGRYCMFESQGKKGLLYQTHTYIAPIFDEIEIEDDEPFQVCLGDKWGWLTEEGEFTTDEDTYVLGDWI